MANYNQILNSLADTSGPNRIPLSPKTNCLTCDTAIPPITDCPHKKEKKGSGGSSSGGTDVKTNKSLADINSELLSKKRNSFLFVEPKNLQELQEEFGNNVHYISCRPNVSIARIITELEEFIRELATQSGLKTENVSTKVLGEQLGIEYQSSTDFLKVTFTNRQDQFAFLDRLENENKRLIQLTPQLKEDLANYRKAKLQSDPNNNSTEKNVFNPQPNFVKIIPRPTDI